MLLGEDVTGYLLDLWIAAAMSRPDGVLIGWDRTDIGIESGWESDVDRYVDALLSVGFLEQGEDGIFILHDWLDHNPWASASNKRSEEGVFNNLKRWYPEIAKQLASQGVSSITKEEYKALTTGKKTDKNTDSPPISVTESDTDRSPNPPSPYPLPSLKAAAEQTDNGDKPVLAPAFPEICKKVRVTIGKINLSANDLETLRGWDFTSDEIDAACAIAKERRGKSVAYIDTILREEHDKKAGVGVFCPYDSTDDHLYLATLRREGVDV